MPTLSSLHNLNILYLIFRTLQLPLSIALLGISSHLHFFGSQPPFNLPHDWKPLSYTWPTWLQWASLVAGGYELDTPIPSTDATTSLSLFIAAVNHSPSIPSS